MIAQIIRNKHMFGENIFIQDKKLNNAKQV